MGRSYTPTYRIDYRDQGGVHTCILDKKHGRPTEANLEQWRQRMNKSFAPGGVNHHVSQGCGYLLHISKAQIVNQKTGAMVASVTGPLFEVV